MTCYRLLVLLLFAPAVYALPFLYVVNNQSPHVAVIDLATRQVAGQINVGSQASELLILPDNRFALLTEYGDNQVRKIDLRNRVSLATLPVGAGPGSIVARSDGRIAYVANVVSNDVSVVDTVNLVELTRISVGTSPIQVNRRPDGRFVYALNQDDNSVSVIDTATNQVISSVPTGTRPNQFAIHPAGQRAFIPNRGSNTVSVFDMTTNTVARAITVAGREPGIIQFAPDGSRIFVLNRASGTVDIINNSSLAIEGSFTVGPEPTDIAITSDGLYAYVAVFGGGQVAVVDLTNIRRIDVSPVNLGTGTRPFTLQFDADENFVYVVLLGSGEVAVLNTSNDQVIARMQVGTSPVGIAQMHQPFIYPGGVVNGASFAAGAAVSGGAIVSLFGESLVIEEGIATALPLRTELGGTQVRINGVAAPLFFTSGLQINAVMPSSAFGRSSVTVEVVGPNGTDVKTISVAATAPGIFTIGSTGSGPGAILDAGFNLVSAERPARPLDTVQLFCTGLGQTNPAIQDGMAVSGPTPVVGNVTVNMGGRAAPPSYAGLAPGFAGLYQVNFQVPADTAAGNVNVSITANGIVSNTVTLAVR